MKRILCLIDTLGMGGAERQMIGLALFLKQNGYHVDLITYCEHDFYSELVQKYVIGSVTYILRIISGRNYMLSVSISRRQVVMIG